MTTEVTYTAVSDTSISSTKTSTGAINATGTAMENFTIANGFRDFTTITSQDTTTLTVPVLGDLTTVTDTVITFTPFSRAPIDEVCENQTWTDTHNIKTDVTVTSVGVTTPSSNTTSVSTVSTVLSINESVTVDAGTFTTFKFKIEDGSLEILNWVDIATGMSVKTETRDASGNLVGTQELLQ